MYSIHNEGKSVVGERYDFSIKNVHIDKLADLINHYNSTNEGY